MSNGQCPMENAAGGNPKDEIRMTNDIRRVPCLVLHPDSVIRAARSSWARRARPGAWQIQLGIVERS